MEHKHSPQFSASSQSTQKEAELFKKKADELFNKGLEHLREKNDQDSLNKAAHCFRKATTLGHTLAEEFLAYCCFDDPIITATYMPSFEEWAKARDQEEIQRRAIFFLGYCYYYGKCARTQSYKTAAKLFYKIWTMGMVGAQYYLALCCLQGRITKIGKKDLMEDFSTTYSPEIHGTSERQKSIFLAEKFARLAAERGHSEAQYLLGMIWLESDFSKAYGYCNQAAQQGHIDARNFLASFAYEYCNGFTLHSYPAHLPLLEQQIFILKIKNQILAFKTKLEIEQDQDNFLQHASQARKKAEIMFPTGSTTHHNSTSAQSFNQNLYSDQQVSEAKANTIKNSNQHESTKTKFSFDEFARSPSLNAEENQALLESKSMINTKAVQTQISVAVSETQNKPITPQTQTSTSTIVTPKTESKTSKQIQFANDKVTILKHPDSNPKEPKQKTSQQTKTPTKAAEISRNSSKNGKDTTAQKPKAEVTIKHSDSITKIPTPKSSITANEKSNTKIETKITTHEVKQSLNLKPKQKLLEAKTSTFNFFGILEEDSSSIPEPSHTYFDNESMKEGKILFEQGFVLFNERKYAQALACFIKAESNNYPPANLFLGLIYSSDFYGVPKNTKRSNDYYTTAKRLFEHARAIPEFPGINYDFARYFFTVQQDQQALDYLDTSAQLGDADAQFHLSLLCLKDPAVNEEFGPALEWLEKSAAQNHREAQSSLGQHYLQLKQLDLALLWLEKAAKGNDADAQFCLAQYYLENKNIAKAESLLLKAAQHGHVNAQYLLGIGYLQFKQYKQSSLWLYEAAKNNHALALVVLKYLSNLSNYYKSNINVSFTPYKLIESGNKPFASELNNLEKKNEPKLTEEELRQKANEDYELACNFYFGRDGNPQSYKKAANKFYEAAITGHKDAQYHYGLCCSKGHGVAKDEAEAIAWLNKAIAQGYPEAKAELDQLMQPKPVAAIKISSKPLSASNKNSNQSSAIEIKSSSIQTQVKAGQFIYSETDGDKLTVEFSKDETKAILKVKSDPYSIYGLGMDFYHGVEIAKEKDYKKAIALFNTALEMGSEFPLYHLGQCYKAGGFGINQDLNKATKILQQAFQVMLEEERSGSQFVFLHLAYSYWCGDGTKQDFAVAASYFHKAYNVGLVYPDSQYLLGIYYSEMDYNFEKAKHWLGSAAQQGHEKAKNKLAELVKQDRNFTNPISKKTETPISHTVETKTETKKSESGESCIQEGFILMDLKQNRNAEEQFMKAIRTYNYHAGFLCMGLAFFMKGMSPDIWYKKAQEYSQWFLETTDNPHRNLFKGMYISFILNDKTKDGFNSLKYAADNGVLMAQKFLASYYFAQGTKFYNFEKGIATIELAIKNGHHGARDSLLGIFDHTGKAEDYLRHIDMGVQNNEPGCLHKHALALYNDHDPDPYRAQVRQKQAGQLFERAMLQGYIPSTHYLGLCYFHGKGGKTKDFNLAHELISKAAYQHHIESQAFLKEYKPFFDLVIKPGSSKESNKIKPQVASDVSQSSSSAFFGQKPATTKHSNNGSSNGAAPTKGNKHG